MNRRCLFNKKVLILAIVILLPMLDLVSCGKMSKNEETLIVTEECGIQHDEEFDGVYIKYTIEDFEKFGFEKGDSVDIEFCRNGKTYLQLSDIPYLSGYYVKNGERLLVAYKGYPYIEYAYAGGPGSWTAEKLKKGDTSIVRLNKKGKYKDIENTFNLVYSDKRNDFDSDVKFANYRSLQGGKLKKNKLYRGASPCDNKHNRASYVNKLIEQDEIGLIIDLADTEEKVKEYLEDENSKLKYFKSLYDDGNVEFAGLGSDYRDDECKKQLGESLKALMNFDGKVYINCTEGKDRTGFVCALLEALAGTTVEEIVKDYMATYGNYYGILKSDDLKKYQAIVDLRAKDILAAILCKDTDYQVSGNEDFKAGAKKYLDECGLNKKEIEKLCKTIMK